MIGGFRRLIMCSRRECLKDTIKIEDSYGIDIMCGDNFMLFIY